MIHLIILAIVLIWISKNFGFLLRCAKTVGRDFKIFKFVIQARIKFMRTQRSKQRLYNMFEETIKRFGENRVACVLDGVEWTYKNLKDFCDHTASVYKKMGIEQGDHIVLYSETTAFYSQLWLAADKIGAATGLINYSQKKDPLKHSLMQIETKLVITSASLACNIEEIDLPPRCQVLVFDDEITIPDIEQRKAACNVRSKLVADILKRNPSWCSFDQLFADSQRLGQVQLKRYSISDPLIYVYTSGTTGLPKAAIISQGRYMLMTSGVNNLLGITSEDVIYTSLPLYHTAGGIAGVGQCLLFGAKQVLRKKFSASQFWNDCVKYECTVVQYIGEICRYLLMQPVIPAETKHKVRLCFGNGMRMQVWKEFQDRFKVKQIGEIYGATESSANMINCDNKLGAVGFASIILPWAYPLKLVKVDLTTGEILRDPKTGFCQELGFNEPGQLIGQLKMSFGLKYEGYANKTESNKKIIKDVFKKGDTWFLTGDVLLKDEYGYFYFMDRLGDTFRWRGENVSTNEVEGVLSKGIDLNGCVVFGVEIPKCEGKAGMTAIIIDDDQVPSDKAEKIKHLQNICDVMKSYLNENLPQYAHPIFVRFVKDIDMTGTFKMKKTDLVKFGYDPTKSNEDTLFFYNPRNKKYELLDEAAYSKIINSEIGY